MYDLSEEFKRSALKELKHNLFSDLNCGGRCSNDHYFTVVANALWTKYADWKNRDSARSECSLKIKDIAAGCRTRGIDFELTDSEIFLKMENLCYRFENSFLSSFGGPVDYRGEFRGYGLDVCGLFCSSRAFFRLLCWFDKAVIGLREEISGLIDSYCSQFKRAQILQSSAAFTFEPGLEDLDYRYSFSADDDREYLNVWVYFKEKESRWMDVVRLTFTCDELSEDPQKVKNIIRSVSNNPSNYLYYRKWAKNVTERMEEFPYFCSEKSAGVCEGI